MRATTYQKEGSNKKWIIPLVIFIASIIFEFFLGNTIFFHSYDSIKGMQEFFNDDLGFSIFDNYYNSSEENKKENNSLYLEFIEDEEDKKIDIDKFVKDVDGKIIFSEMMHYFNSNTFFIMLCAIIYNFANVYKVFILTNCIFIANFISSTLCFIFHSPRPYYTYFSIKPVIMFNEWGSPNTQVVVLIAFSLTLYQVIIKNKKLENNLIGKIIILVIIALFALFDILLLFASGNISYNQIVFSGCIGVVTYQIIFLLLKAEVNNSRQLYNLLKFKAKYYIFINLILICFEYILYAFVIDKYDEDYFTDNINEQQGRLFYSKFLNDNFNYRRLFYLNKGNFCNVICFGMNLVSFLSLKLELFWTYKGDYEAWSSCNFERPPEGNQLLDISADDYFIRDATQWNHTGAFKTTIRLFVMIIFCLCCMVPSVLIYYMIDSSEANGYIFIYGVPMFLLVFGMFYFFKVIFRFFKLAKKR